MLANSVFTTKEKYFSALYGKFTHIIVNYLEEISAFCSPDYFNAKGDRINRVIAERYECLEKIAEKFSVTLNEIENDDEFNKMEFANLSYHREYVFHMSKALKLLASGKTDEAQKNFMELIDGIRKNEMHYQRIFDVYRIIEVATNYTGFDQVIGEKDYADSQIL